MKTVERLTKLARQHARGLMSIQELKAEMLEVLLDDRVEMLEANKPNTHSTQE